MDGVAAGRPRHSGWCHRVQSDRASRAKVPHALHVSLGLGFCVPDVCGAESTRTTKGHNIAALQRTPLRAQGTGRAGGRGRRKGSVESAFAFHASLFPTQRCCRCARASPPALRGSPGSVGSGKAGASRGAALLWKWLALSALRLCVHHRACVGDIWAHVGSVTVATPLDDLPWQGTRALSATATPGELSVVKQFFFGRVAEAQVWPRAANDATDTRCDSNPSPLAAAVSATLRLPLPCAPGVPVPVLPVDRRARDAARDGGSRATILRGASLCAASEWPGRRAVSHAVADAPWVNPRVTLRACVVVPCAHACVCVCVTICLSFMCRRKSTAVRSTRSTRCPTA